MGRLKDSLPLYCLAILCSLSIFKILIASNKLRYVCLSHTSWLPLPALAGLLIIRYARLFSYNLSAGKVSMDVPRYCPLCRAFFIHRLLIAMSYSEAKVIARYAGLFFIHLDKETYRKRVEKVIARYAGLFFIHPCPSQPLIHKGCGAILRLKHIMAGNCYL